MEGEEPTSLLFGRLVSGLEKLQVTRELRPGALQHAHNLLHLGLAVLFEQAGCARTPARALALKIHDIPPRQPGLRAGARCCFALLCRFGRRIGSQGKMAGTAWH